MTKLKLFLVLLITAGATGLQTTFFSNRSKRNVLRSASSNRPLFQALDVSGGGASSEKEQASLPRQLLAELVGTFLLVNIGTGAVMSSVYTDSLSLFPVAAVWSAAVTIAIGVTSKFSGAHLNPAISICFAVLRPNNFFGLRQLVPYVMAQLAGAVLGSAVNLFLYGNTIRSFEAAQGIVRSSANAVGSAKAFGEYFVSPVSTFEAFGAEAVGTLVLALVVFALTHPDNDNPKALIAPSIGLTVGSLICVLAPLSQAGFNPARDFGPRLVAYFAGGWSKVAFQQAWVYIVAPCVGAILGATFVDKVLFKGIQ